MLLPSHIEDSGDVRWAFWNVAADGNTDLVIPKGFRQDAPTPSAGDHFTERNQLVILGISWNLVPDAAGEGFRLTSTEGGEVARTVWEVVASTGTAETTVSAGSIQCFLPLSPAGASTPASAGATLSVVRIGTPAACTVLVSYMHRAARGSSQYGLTPPFTYS